MSNPDQPEQPGQPSAPATSEASAPTGEASAPTGEASAPTGVMFGSAAAALAFWAAAAGAGLARDARARRGPDGRYWVEVAAPPAHVRALAAAAGGAPLADPARAELLARTWSAVDVRHLLAASALRPAPLRAEPEVMAFVPAPLARWVLDRALARSLDVHLVPATWQPVDRDQPGHAGVWMRIRGPGGHAGSGHTRASHAGEPRAPVPAAWLRAIADLPGAVIARPTHDGAPGDPRLCVDIRYRTPVPEPLLARLLAAGPPAAGDPREVFLLAGPDVGPGWIAPGGDWVPGSTLVVAPAVPVIPAPAAGEACLPAPVPVRLVRAPAPALQRLPDAVLVDEQELGWLRTYLMALPLGERVYVVPGMYRTLVIAAAESAAGLPLGTPLVRVGPGALYLEQGLSFAPPLPEPARAAAFPATDDEAVAITAEGAWRFRLRALVPAWTLWVGPGPRLRDAHDEHLGSLRKLGDAFSRAAQAARASDPRSVSRFKLPPDIQPVSGAPLGPRERARLRDEAAADLLRGEVVNAAEKLERAGDPAAAARLYERAARQLGNRHPEPAKDPA
jgi:hypothetical protein